MKLPLNILRTKPTKSIDKIDQLLEIISFESTGNLYKLDFNFENFDVNIDITTDTIDRVLTEKGITDNRNIKANIGFLANHSKFKNISFLTLAKSTFFNKPTNYIISFFRAYSCKFNSLRINVVSVNILLLNSKFTTIRIFGVVQEKVRLDNVTCDSLTLNYTLTASNPKTSQLLNTVVKKDIAIRKSSMEKLTIRFLDVNKAIDSSLEEIRGIKQILDNRGNTYDFLNLLSCEQRIIKNELHKGTKWYGKWSEKVLLFLNRISNGFGINWSRGVLFTLTINLLGSTFLYMSLFGVPLLHSVFETPICCKNIIPELPNIFFSNFSPIYKTELLEKHHASIWAYVIHLLSKIFVFYGIYQTVQAFRKYRR